jgi:hypothetical protein
MTKHPEIGQLNIYRIFQDFGQIFYHDIGEKQAKALPGCIINLSTLFFHKVCILKSLIVRM